ncbi:(2Fe-2S)-binding protein [Candidatus Xianfuyuplasma coldseepsis]|uniref:(2Fe-2S)-binding protein n=1 Tax=Candidatus Xianfuyuplasma coldseepsis TaxID=2782163 RepID=A0A7L7KTW0_9MOLU|nr:(2Fe-2S)-binding protein [Xianfuyuplasma coldseepsis]QMS85859.1 (2Fe-2S)-binding protein [Xianfuyuplasma coldseepsis]
MYQDDDVICYCAEVTYKQIKQAIQKGAKTIDHIGDINEAGIACGTCIEDLEIIVKALIKE